MHANQARDLIRRCATHRDYETWERFRRRYERWLTVGVYRTLVRYEAKIGQDEQEDLVQEVYLRLLERNGKGLRRCRGEAEGAIVVYLGKVTESVVVDYLRSRSAAKRGRELEDQLGDELEPGLADRFADSRPSPEEQLLCRERRDLLLSRCWQSLIGQQTRQRDLAVLYLALFEGWTSREISRRIDGGMTPSAVDSLLHRVKRRLRKVGIELPRR